MLKRRKTFTSRVKMTEDELIMHFFQFDEAGKGGITVHDLAKVADAHDFTWTDEELANMIHCFDSDGDGKVQPTTIFVSSLVLHANPFVNCIAVD
ncbi:cell division control protein 31-like [Eucalyptus grandis]|uniref:cell division control protein 31-like n=1 Tax=Eucalyptus grandis TaxID=71139 RepID=UPI00052676CA|nr:cell division control protein 31-like [Eucalyptus grandis]XP_039167788.1 cell division control protein 31-like [Eucalyptus grandis]